MVYLLKVKNHAIRMFLHGAIKKIFARDKKGRGVSSPFQRGDLYFFLRVGVILARRGVN